MDKMLYDIEVFPNYFCVGLKDYVTKKIIFYEISDERNDLHQIYEYFTKYSGFLISFNGIHYDNMIMKYLILNYNKYKSYYYGDICFDLKWFSDKIINGDYDDSVKDIKYQKMNWIDIDLFSYWSKMLRISKKISLKSLGIQLGYPVVQELPFKPDTILQSKDLEAVRVYNYTHDLGILDLLTKEMESDIRLRANISQQYNLNCWSWDAPKIASEALLQDYCKKTKQVVYTVRKQKYIRPTIYFKDCLQGFDPKFKLPLFKNLWDKILNSKDNISENVLVNYGNTNIRLTYGIGGLHSVNENEKYFTDDNIQIVTSDIASLYPNIIINYNCIRFPEVLERYSSVKFERIEAKKNKDKEKDLFLKLILNSTSGLLDNEHSWLYFPEGAMRLRLIGQLFLTKCIEVCLINNWQVISANTDGIEVLVPKKYLQQYQQLLDIEAKRFNLEFEHEHYNYIVYKNVNNYICKTANDKVKRKGLFLLDFDENSKRETPLGNSCDELVISKALNEYYNNDIPPEEFINNPEKYNLHIYDYCKSNKISKNFDVYYNGVLQQNLNRYYFSKNKPYLFKQKDGIGTMQHVNVGQGVTLYNNHKELKWEEYDINYSYYISQTKKIINEINNNNQLKLFT